MAQEMLGNMPVNSPRSSSALRRIPWFRARRSYLEPLLADCTIFTQLLRRALEHDMAVAHDVQALRNVERDRQLLLHQQDGNAAVLDFIEQLGQQLDDFRRQALGGL